MNFKDKLPSWITALLKNSAKLDEKPNSPEYPIAKHFDGGSTVLEKGYTGNDSVLKVKLDTREGGNPAVESILPKSNEKGETDIILDKPLPKVSEPPKATDTSKDTDAVINPSKLNEPVVLKNILEDKSAPGGTVRPEAPKDTTKTTPRGEAAHVVSQLDNYALVTKNDRYAILYYPNGFESQGRSVAYDLMEKEANYMWGVLKQGAAPGMPETTPATPVSNVPTGATSVPQAAPKPAIAPSKPAGGVTPGMPSEIQQRMVLDKNTLASAFGTWYNTLPVERKFALAYKYIGEDKLRDAIQHNLTTESLNQIKNLYPDLFNEYEKHRGGTQQNQPQLPSGQPEIVIQ